MRSRDEFWLGFDSRQRFSLQWRHTLCLNLGLLQMAPEVDLDHFVFLSLSCVLKFFPSFLPSQPSWTARIGKKVEDRIRCGVDDIRKREHCILTVGKSFFLPFSIDDAHWIYRGVYYVVPFGKTPSGLTSACRRIWIENFGRLLK